MSKGVSIVGSGHTIFGRLASRSLEDLAIAAGREALGLAEKGEGHRAFEDGSVYRGDIQCDNANLGMVFNMGGSGVANYASALEARPA